MDYIPSAKNLNTEDLFKITFNYFVKIHQISDVIFEIISHFHDATSVYFFSSNITYFLQKQPIKVQVFKFSTALKFTNFLISFFKQKVSFSSKFVSLFSGTRDNFSALFQLKLYMLLIKVANQSANLQTCHCSH